MLFLSLFCSAMDFFSLQLEVNLLFALFIACHPRLTFSSYHINNILLKEISLMIFYKWYANLVLHFKPQCLLSNVFLSFNNHSRAKYCQCNIGLTRVNFTNVLQAAFMRVDPKSAIKLLNLTVFFALLGSARIKAACRTLVKLTPDLFRLNLDVRRLTSGGSRWLVNHDSGVGKGMPHS